MALGLSQVFCLNSDQIGPGKHIFPPPVDLWYIGPIFPELVSDIFLSTRFEARVGGDMDGAENEGLRGGLNKVRLGSHKVSSKLGMIIVFC